MPNLKNDLIITSENSENATIVSKFFKDEDWAIILGYKSAGDKIVDTMDGMSKIIEVYPVIFLYRHFVESYIKYIYKKYISKNNKEYVVFIKKVSHKIIESFEEILPIIDEYYLKQNNYGDNKNIIEATKKYIEQLANIDYDSSSFRYTMNKKGEKLRTEEIKIDLVNMKKRISELANLFFEIEENITYTKELEKEYERSICDNY